MAKTHRLHKVKSSKLDMTGFLNLSLTIANRNNRHVETHVFGCFIQKKKKKLKKRKWQYSIFNDESRMFSLNAISSETLIFSIWKFNIQVEFQFSKEIQCSTKVKFQC